MKDSDRFARFEAPEPIRGKRLTVLDDGAFTVAVTAAADELEFIMAQAERTGEDPLFVVGQLAYRAFLRHYKSSTRRLKRMSTSSRAKRRIR